MAHNDSPRPDEHRPAEPTVPQETVASPYGEHDGYPEHGGYREHDDASRPGAAPSAGWGAPQEQTQQYPGWVAPPEQLYAQPAPGWGAAGGKGPHAPAARWRGLTSTQKGVAAAAAAVVIAGGAGAAVWAANSSKASTDSSAANGFGGAAGQGGFGPQGGTGAQGGTGQQGGSAAQGSTNVTMVEQAGTVTAASGQSVTVKSSDGFQQTYALSSSTQIAARGMRGRGASGSGASGTETLAVGETVSVMALKDGLAAQTVMILGAGAGTGTGTGSGTSS